MVGSGDVAWAQADRFLIALIAVAISALGSTPGSAAPTVDERELLGESFQGRPIHVFHRGDPDEIRVLVVGCIHGDECAGSGSRSDCEPAGRATSSTCGSFRT